LMRLHISETNCLVSLVATLVLSSVLASCTSQRAASDEILIALRPEAIPLLIRPEDPDPEDTGIPSIDSLNLKWHVRQMVRVFNDVSQEDEAAVRYGLAGVYRLVLPTGTDLVRAQQDYETDPYIDYAEPNQPYEIK
jgi:hypothetical protein